MPEKKTRRLNLELSAQARERLESLKERSDLSTMTDVVKRSLFLYDVMLKHQNAGGFIVLQGKDGSEERLLLL